MTAQTWGIILYRDDSFRDEIQFCNIPRPVQAQWGQISWIKRIPILGCKLGTGYSGNNLDIVSGAITRLCTGIRHSTLTLADASAWASASLYNTQAV